MFCFLLYIQEFSIIEKTEQASFLTISLCDKVVLSLPFDRKAETPESVLTLVKSSVLPSKVKMRNPLQYGFLKCDHLCWKSVYEIEMRRYNEDKDASWILISHPYITITLALQRKLFPFYGESKDFLEVSTYFFPFTSRAQSHVIIYLFIYLFILIFLHIVMYLWLLAMIRKTWFQCHPVTGGTGSHCFCLPIDWPKPSLQPQDTLVSLPFRAYPHVKKRWQRQAMR